MKTNTITKKAIKNKLAHPLYMADNLCRKLRILARGVLAGGEISINQYLNSIYMTYDEIINDAHDLVIEHLDVYSDEDYLTILKARQS